MLVPLGWCVPGMHGAGCLGDAGGAAGGAKGAGEERGAGAHAAQLRGSGGEGEGREGRAVGSHGDTKRALLALGLPAGSRKARAKRPTARQIARLAREQKKLEARLAARAAMLRAKQARRALCAKTKAPTRVSGKLSAPGLEREPMRPSIQHAGHLAQEVTP